MDTVWMKLHITVDGRIKEDNFMFGPTGIVRFRTENTGTKLFNSSTLLVAEVREDSEYIMDVLGKMRGTKGRLNEEPKVEEQKGPKKVRSTSKTKA